MRHVSRHGTLRAEARSAPAADINRATPPNRDLLDRRAEQVRRSEFAFREVVEKGWDGALVLDKHGYVRFLNAPAKKILGPQSERLIGHNFGLPAVGRRGVEIQIARGPGDDRTAEMRVIDGPWEGEKARIVLIRDVTDAPADRDESEPTVAAAMRETTRTLTEHGNGPVDPEILAGRLCACLLELVPSCEAHTYLRDSNGDFFHVARDSARAGEAGWPPPARFSVLEVEDLQTTLDREDLATGLPSHVGHPFPSGLAARMSLAWLVVTPLRHEGRTIGLQLLGGTAKTGPSPQAEQALSEASRIAGLAIGSAQLRAEIHQLERARSEILSMVSHELRSPLHVILGYENLLREGGLGKLSDEQHDALVRIGRNAQQLAGLIENTLTAGRIDSEQLPGGTREVRACDITRDIEDEMASLYGDRDIELRWDVPETLPRLYTEPDKLKVILRNLVSNAVKFTDEGTVAVSARREDGGLAITVTDTGIGIAQDHLDEIFEQFRQAPVAGSNERGGVGLGLYIVQRMVEKLEGTVSVHSVPGEGSAFTIWLPLRVGAVHAAA